MTKHTILVVDDEQPVLRIFRRILERAGYGVLVAGTTLEAEQVLKEIPVDVVLCDHVLPGEPGLTFLERLQRSHPKVKRVLVTGFGDLHMAMNAVNKAKVHHIISKPFEPEDVLACLESLLSAPSMAPPATALPPQDGSGSITRLRDSYPGIDVVNRNTQGRILLDDQEALGGRAGEQPESSGVRMYPAWTPQLGARKRPEPGHRIRRGATMLRELEAEHPGISMVERTGTGSIVLDENMYRTVRDTIVIKRPSALFPAVKAPEKQAQPQPQPQPQDGGRPLEGLLGDDPSSEPDESRSARHADSGPFDTDIVFDEAILKLIG